MDSDAGDRYRQLLREWTAENRVRVKNELIRELQREYLSLKATEAGRSSLVRMLDHDDVRVRYSAGIHTLTWATEASLATLENIAAGDSGLAFSARIMLDTVLAGTAKPDWEPPPRPSRRKANALRVTGEDLDNAIEINGLIMNGGIFHAWHNEPAKFDAAVVTIAAVGRGDAAAVLREAAVLFTSVYGDLTTDDDLLDAAGWEKESALSSAYYALPDPQDQLESEVPLDD